MSLTDLAELKDMFAKPVKKEYHPNFLGDGKTCDYNTGHCTNTGACDDCIVYQSTQEVREYSGCFEPVSDEF